MNKDIIRAVVQQNGSKLNLLKVRGNIVGVKSVDKVSYTTITSTPTITVGASGADYTSLQLAYNAAPDGATISLIDDTLNLPAAVLTFNTAKHVRILGKATITNIVGANVRPCINITANGSGVVFENIKFNDANACFLNYSYGNQPDFVHFINCNFDTGGVIDITNIREAIFDGCIINGKHIEYTIYDTIYDSVRILINNCTVNNETMTYLLKTTQYTGVKKQISYLSVTNSSIHINQANAFLNTVFCVAEVDIRGNTTKNNLQIGSEIGAGVYAPYIAYNAATNYVVGDKCCNKYNLWECIVNSTGNEPDLGSAYWKLATLVTGKVENNTITNTSETPLAKHGIFIAGGAGYVSVKNNISSNWVYQFVIKGHTNTIEYNCAGKGDKAFGIYINDQASFRNNTSRIDTNFIIQYAPQLIGGTGVTETDFKFNILTTAQANQNALDNYADKYTNPVYNNEFIGNQFYGSRLKAILNNITYDLSDETGLANFITATGDTEANFIDPEFEGSDPTLQSYYKPTNPLILEMKDDLGQAIGAVDYAT